MSTLLDRTETLRAEAYRELRKSPAFAAYQALDDAVVALGGESEIPSEVRRSTAIDPNSSDPRVAEISRRLLKHEKRERKKRLTQANAAEAVLKDIGEPLPIGRLLEKAIELGLEIGGSDPLSNFRSTLSKDERFYSRMRNGMYFWWLAGVPLPQDWIKQEAPDLLSTEGSDASVGTSEKGGDGHAATMPS